MWRGNTDEVRVRGQKTITSPAGVQRRGRTAGGPRPRSASVICSWAILLILTIIWFYVTKPHKYVSGPANIIKRVIYPPEMNLEQADDLYLAEGIIVGEAGTQLAGNHQSAAQKKSIAFLFMAADSLQYLDLWTNFLRGAKENDLYHVYLHFSDTSQEAKARQQKTVDTLQQQNVNVQVVPTAKTHWCGLVGAMVSLYAAAFKETNNIKFVLLAYDSIPLRTFPDTWAALLDKPDVSSVCFAGVARVETPLTCSYSVKWFWKQALQLKHHQWTVLARTGVQKMLSPKRWAAARQLFEDVYTGEPLCSDEIMPVLSMLVGDDGKEGDDLKALMHSTDTLYNTNAILAKHGIEARCQTFVFWPGCISPHPSAPLSSFNEFEGADAWVNVHPIVLDASVGVSQEKAKMLIDELRHSGFFFTRKAPSLAMALATESASSAAYRIPPNEPSLGSLGTSGGWEGYNGVDSAEHDPLRGGWFAKVGSREDWVAHFRIFQLFVHQSSGFTLFLLIWWIFALRHAGCIQCNMNSVKKDFDDTADVERLNNFIGPA